MIRLTVLGMLSLMSRWVSALWIDLVRIIA
jgi:hypothetical protein